MKSVHVLGALLAVVMTATIARAQPAPLPPPQLAPPPSSADVAAAPGMRIATGQAPVVGGNAAGARERAFDEAIRQAVEATLNEAFDPATRAAQAKTVKALLTRPRVFAPRYRTLEEGEANGVYSVRVEVEVDEVALRRKLDRPGSSTGPVPTAGPAPAVVVTAGDASPASGALAPAVVASLGAAGVRARAGTTDATVRVTADVGDEGVVRGTGRSSFACRAEARPATAPPAGPSFAPQTAIGRVFASSLEAGRADCVTRLAGELSRRIAAALPSGAGTASGDLRSVTVDAELAEPGAVPVLLKSVRSLGLVSAAELTRIAGGRAEIRARLRASTAALAAALPRTASSPILFSDVEVAGDVIRLRARLRPMAQPAPPPAEATP